MSEFFSQPQEEESFVAAIDQREMLVSAAIETSICLANVHYLEEEFENHRRKEIDSSEKIVDRIVDLRRELAKTEIELQKKKNALLKREEVFVEANKKAFASYKSLERQIKAVQINGDDDDRKSIEAIFYRPIDKQSDAPFVLPRDSGCFTLPELFHETYGIISLSNNITIPEEAKVNIRSAIMMSGDEMADQRGHLKLARVFKRTSKPDVFHFLMSNTALEEMNCAASVYGVALRNRSFGADFHSQPLNLICWFGPAVTSGGVFPKCRGDTFTLQVVGTDYGPYKTIYSSNERTHLTPEIISTLNRLAQQFGIEKNSRFPQTSKISVDIDWTNGFWRRRLPLEFIDSDSGETKNHDNCSLSVVPLAVRIKCGKSENGEQLPNVFSVLCHHEKTNQVFWQKFDANQIDDLLQHRSECKDISECGCKHSFFEAMQSYGALEPKDRLSSSSPLHQLRCSEPKNEGLLNRYAILDNLKNCSNMDPAFVLSEGRLTGNVKPYVADLFPEIGYTVCVNSIHTNRNRASLLKTKKASEDDDNDVEEEEEAEEEEEDGAVQQTSKGKRKTTTDMEVSGGKKRVAVCGICGLANSNKSSHLKPNHGKKFALTKEEKSHWLDSLTPDKAKELANV